MTMRDELTEMFEPLHPDDRSIWVSHIISLVNAKVDEATRIVRTWGGAPPSPSNRRGRLADTIQKLKEV